MVHRLKRILGSPADYDPAWLIFIKKEAPGVVLLGCGYATAASTRTSSNSYFIASFSPSCFFRRERENKSAIDK